jgi:hypothetical protein
MERCGAGSSDALQSVADCAAVVAVRMGEAPRYELERMGIRFFAVYDYVVDAARNAYAACQRSN